ncbi:Polynucleotidyl transferase [Heracleum sosnowskyi]|uniref:Polynucleotidyl transferase n=1 Tax=Heracleum sosnowskyi TaxID=360622 RepID=A0AAD8HUD7_9APIA|nr:Polynucleotidyl transferase [Heracleum sosnowskyi]
MLAKEAFPAIKTTSRALQQHLFLLLQNSQTYKQLEQIHTQIIINAFSHKNFILVNLLSSYISSGHFRKAHEIFNQANSPSTTAWNQILRGYLMTQLPRESIKLYSRMVGSGVKEEEYTYSYVVTACVKAMALREGMQVHGRVLCSGFCGNVVVNTNLVNFYGVGGGEGLLREARRVFDEMSERNVVTWNCLLSGYVRWGDIGKACGVFDEMVEKNVVSWTIMIVGFVRNGKFKRSLSLFYDMWRGCVKFDRVTLVAVLSACAELGDLRLGRWVHSYYIRGNLDVENDEELVSLHNALVHMYASCGLVDESFIVFKAMPRRSTVSWTSMIMGFAKQGRGKEAIEVFRWMQGCGDNDVRPDGITLLSVLCACSHAGLVEEGRYFFNCIQTWGIQPMIEHYGCMVDILSRAGHLDEAHRLVTSMSMKPNDAVWGALLGGCKIHKNAELASLVAQKLVGELHHDQAAGYLVLLSNVYATAKKWQDVVDVRRIIVEDRVKKTPGQSWIQIDGIIQNFMAGEQKNIDAHLVYRILSDVSREGSTFDAQLGIEE